MSNPKANLLLIGKQSADSKQTDKNYGFGKQSARIISAKQNALVCAYSMAVFSFVHNIMIGLAAITGLTARCGMCTVMVNEHGK